MAIKSKKKEEIEVVDQNPNPKLSEDQIKSLKKKQIIGIVVCSVLLAIAIVMTVLVYTVLKK